MRELADRSGLRNTAPPVPNPHAGLVEGHLGFVVCALGERAAVDPSFEPLRAQLTEDGCAPLRALLGHATARGSLPDNLDAAGSLAALEGPVFYRAMVRREAVGAAALPAIVDAFLAAPPPTILTAIGFRPLRAGHRA